ncbi:MAG: sensor histidine kinase [Planctomycetota bacterium]
MVKSLRWKLQLWHAVILVLAILGFSGVLYLQFHRSLLREVDAELLAGARALEGTLKLAPRFVLESGFPEGPLDRPLGRGPVPGRGGGPPEFRPPGERNSAGRNPPDRPPPPIENEVGRPLPPPPDGPGRPRAEGPPPQEDRAGRPPGGPRGRPMSPEQWMELLTLPQGPPLNTNEPQPPDQPPPRAPFSRPVYYSIYAANGSLIKASSDAVPSVSFSPTRRPLEYRNRDFRRELLLAGPEKSVVIVGQDVRPQFRQLQWLATQLLAIGLTVLAIGLLGGWWLAGRAIRPIEQISQKAKGIEASKLSERFNVEATDAELREMGEVLNSMLGRLEAGFDQQSRFTSDASHELRTPLAVLLSHAELALSRQRSPAEYQAALQTIQRSGQRMKELVEDLLVLARANSGRLELRKEPTDLKRLAEEAAQLLKPLADAEGVRLEVSGSHVEQSVDPARLNQALVNLIGNGIKYNRPGGTVSVEVSSDSGIATIRIKDTGEGIPAESLPHLFEPFYRVDAARSRETGGSGLGLAITRRLVNAHGGEIAVTSEVGAGSCFEIRLPI